MTTLSIRPNNLSPDEVGDGFVMLMEERSLDARLIGFCKYLVD